MSTLECVCIEIWFLSDELNGFFKKKSPGPIFFFFLGREYLVVVIIVKIYRIDHSPCVHTHTLGGTTMEHYIHPEKKKI